MIATSDKFQAPILPSAEVLHPKLGIALEQGANAATAVRAVGGIALSKYIENTPDYQSWGTFFAFAGLVISDAEGVPARLGRKLQGKDESVRRPLNAYGDHLADKVLIDGILFAIATIERQNGNETYSTMVRTSAEVTTARDVVTTVDRVIADVQDIDTRAQSEGKRKAALQYLITGFALSPLAKNETVKKLLGGAFMYTASKSIRSGWALHKSFSHQRKARKRLTRSD